MELTEKLSAFLGGRLAELKKFRDRGGKVVGYFDGYVPEELIHASGAIPVRLVRGGDAEAVAAASAYMPGFMCPLVKAQLGYRLLGEEPLYQLIDLAVVGISCIQWRRLADYWDMCSGAEVFRLGVPHDCSDQAVEYYTKRLSFFKESLEKLTGRQIKDKELSESINLCNQVRELLRNISLLRKHRPPQVSGKDFFRLCHASHYADEQAMVDFMGSVYQELVGRESIDLSGPRILLTGPALAVGDYKVVDLIEETGAAVVAEEFCEGIRHYWVNVDGESNPLEALARRYIQKRAPAAYQRPSKRRIDFVVELAKEFSVDGVIWYQLKFCETYDIESYYFTEVMRKIGLPVLKIESIFDASERLGLKTRIEAFIESIKGR